MDKKVVTLQDISCFGKCSLTVALPVISAMGISCSIIPTAVLSTHTGGFTGYTFRDLTEDIQKISDHWKTCGITFDGIYTGYLGSCHQVDVVSDFIAQNRREGALVFIDPAMADNGVLYSGFDSAFVDSMRELCREADIVVPNITEASMLLNAVLSFATIPGNRFVMPIISTAYSQAFVPSACIFFSAGSPAPLCSVNPLYPLRLFEPSVLKVL